MMMHDVMKKMIMWLKEFVNYPIDLSYQAVIYLIKMKGISLIN